MAYSGDDPSEILTLGGPWSWSDIASQVYVKQNKWGKTEINLLVPYNRTEGIIEALDERYRGGDLSATALVPIWNTNEGRVKDTIRPSGGLIKHPQLKMAGEYVQDIEQSIAGHGDLNVIRTVVSHPQALAQSQGWLKKLRQRQQIEIVEAPSTSAAVEIAKKDTTGRTVAICSPQAAEAYELPLLERGVDRTGDSVNKTRFVLLSHTDGKPTGKDKTTLTMELVGAEHAGTLYQALGVLAASRINASYIESMPQGSLTEYTFWLDVDEHRERMEAELNKLKDLTKWLQIHGSYPRAYP